MVIVGHQQYYWSSWGDPSHQPVSGIAQTHWPQFWDGYILIFIYIYIYTLYIYIYSRYSYIIIYQYTRKVKVVSSLEPDTHLQLHWDLRMLWSRGPISCLSWGNRRIPIVSIVIPLYHYIIMSIPITLTLIKSYPNPHKMSTLDK